MAENDRSALPPPPFPRVHRPRAPIMTQPAPLIAPLTPLRPQNPVSLVTPRPENERSTNEYVETPFKASAEQNVAPPVHSRMQRPHRLNLPPPIPTNPISTITKQPTSFSKDNITSILSTSECTTRPSIMCPNCGRCRCDSCQQPRPLPEKWICNNACLLSADSVIDYTSCLCCVKGLFYHCSDSDSADNNCADNPCGCNPDRRLARWGCLTVLSCALPCLLMYWPLRGAKKVVEQCYVRHTRSGCTCKPVLTPEKRLLDSNSDF